MLEKYFSFWCCCDDDDVEQKDEEKVQHELKLSHKNHIFKETSERLLNFIIYNNITEFMLMIFSIKMFTL